MLRRQLKRFCQVYPDGSSVARDFPFSWMSGHVHTRQSWHLGALAGRGSPLHSLGAMSELRATAIGALALASLSYTATSAQGQQDLNRQAEQAARSSEAKLKAAVDSYRKTLSERQLVLFDASQEKWAAY